MRLRTRIPSAMLILLGSASACAGLLDLDHLGYESPSDGGALADTSVDALADAGSDSPLGSYCVMLPKTPYFCEDFDTTWPEASIAMYNNCRITRADTQAKSAPYAALLSTVNDDSGAGSTGYLIVPTIDAAATPLKVILEFAMRIELRTQSTSRSDAAVLALLDFGSSHLEVLATSDRVYMASAWPGPNYEAYEPDAGAVDSDWHTFRLTFALAGPSKTASLDIDDRRILDRVPLSPGFEVGKPAARVGFIGAYATNTPWQLRFDNVTLAYEL